MRISNSQDAERERVFEALRKVREARRVLIHTQDPNGRLNGRLEAIALLDGVLVDLECFEWGQS